MCVKKAKWAVLSRPKHAIVRTDETKAAENMVWLL